MTNDTGVLMEWFLESLGWPDFLISLWGSNVEMIIKAIAVVRKSCKASTTTIIGVTPEETSMVEEDMQSIVGTRGRRGLGSRPVHADVVFTEYIAWQKAFVMQMEDSIGKKVKAKKIKSEQPTPS